MTRKLDEARKAYAVAQSIEDANDKRRASAIPFRDIRYLSERLRTAQQLQPPTSTDTVAFGSTVTFERSDGRVQTFRIVGEDEADPQTGSISYVSPVARMLMGKAADEVVGSGTQELRILTIA